ncbi:substrate-binding domain-containing protein [Fulvivirgaceae bacterium BMA10]|uniref:Substrate-binding domain-containing protein n=1 Tax=Splendidivirga corallicola TaxID=3051826 RepID=A0ABT8KSD3_9BACT|nr:substrate-binding domain-containing protein [Fulvivirgaceae bacterium BMA10]
MSKIKKTTIQDVAKYANVSSGTIDRVIHNRGKVSPAKKKKIEEAIKHLNFNPNLLARTLALGKQFMICSLLPESVISQNYWSLPRRGIMQSAEKYKDFGIVLEAYEYSLFDEESFVKQAQIIIDKNPDGVILAPLFEKESISFTQALEEKNIPYIFIDANIPDQNNLSYIGPELKNSGYIAGKLLNSILNMNDDILIVNMVKGIENSSHVWVIEDGFREFFDSNNYTNDRKINSLTIHTTDETEVTRELTKYYIKNPGVKGVFVTNSKAHLISEFHRAHELDGKVIGFDLIEENIASLKNGSIDFLISQNPVFQGGQAVQMLFDYFVYKKTPTEIQYVPLDIIIKENVDFYLNSQ